MPEITALQWEEFIHNNQQAHLLQTRAWGELKSAFGWKVIHLKAEDNGCQVMLKRIFPGISMAYIPKGPVVQDWQVLIPEIDHSCRRHKASFVKIEPDEWENLDQPTQPPDGYIRTSHSIQPLRTAIINLVGDDNSILGGMKQKTRYNINLALRKGVIVSAISDINLFHSLMEVTSKRDGFNVHSLAYYQKAYDLFHPRGGCELFLASYELEPLAALMVFAHGYRAWYLYGASSDLHRDRMPNYLLQWEAMRWARNQGCTEYDLWGIPDVEESTLEQNFQARSDGLWGVYRFKRGFGGEVRRGVGPWDRIYNPVLYKLYRMWLRARRVEA
jgi:lipid II:glycine glycyltransferase (peptidoglycan interpeptide bridge formation enzyme)